MKMKSTNSHFDKWSLLPIPIATIIKFDSLEHCENKS